MIRVEPLMIDGHPVIGIEVALPKTNLLVITTQKGYIMCGALDVALLNERLKFRRIIAGRAVGVRTLQELLDAPLESVTQAANELGIEKGTTGREALRKML